MNVLDLKEIKEEKRKVKESVKLDRAASFATIKKCLDTLNYNKLEELEELKFLMKKTLNKLEKNGNKTG